MVRLYPKTQTLIPQNVNNCIPYKIDGTYNRTKRKLWLAIQTSEPNSPAQIHPFLSQMWNAFGHKCCLISHFGHIKNSNLAPKRGGVKQRKSHQGWGINTKFLSYYSPLPRSHVRIFTHRKWPIMISESWRCPLQAFLGPGTGGGP